MQIKTMINLKRVNTPSVDCVKQLGLSRMAAIKYIVNFGKQLPNFGRFPLISLKKLNFFLKT